MPTTFCRHIHLNGERCGSPALTSQKFCYYHVELDRRHRRCQRHRSAEPAILHPMSLQDGHQRDPILAEPIALPLQLDFPPLEDGHSIQLALSLLITALAQDRIDPKRAALLFYGLQIASANARNLNPLPREQKPIPKVRETILHEPSGEQIAPDQDPEDSDPRYQRLSSADRLLAEILRDHDERDAREERERLAAESQASTECGDYLPPAAGL